jgi:hypothetical protein
LLSIQNSDGLLQAASGLPMVRDNGRKFLLTKICIKSYKIKSIKFLWKWKRFSDSAKFYFFPDFSRAFTTAFCCRKKSKKVTIKNRMSIVLKFLIFHLILKSER